MFNFAALDGGTQVMVFILSFAVQGAAGTSHLFPEWWGANQGGNYDRYASLMSACLITHLFIGVSSLTLRRLKYAMHFLMLYKHD